MERHTFLAVPLPERIKKQIADYAAQVRSYLPLKKWTGQGDFHITLTFLGATTEEQLNILNEELTKRIALHDPFQLHLSKPGAFGKATTPRVFWIGVKPSEALISLQKDIESACSDTGFRMETRPYRPHVTIGKRWNGSVGQAISLNDLPVANQLETLDWQVDECVLYVIHPNETPMYVPWQRYKLNQEDC